MGGKILTVKCDEGFFLGWGWKGVVRYWSKVRSTLGQIRILISYVL